MNVGYLELWYFYCSSDRIRFLWIGRVKLPCFLAFFSGMKCPFCKVQQEFGGVLEPECLTGLIMWLFKADAKSLDCT